MFNWRKRVTSRNDVYLHHDDRASPFKSGYWNPGVTFLRTCKRVLPNFSEIWILTLTLDFPISKTGTNQQALQTVLAAVMAKMAVPCRLKKKKMKKGSNIISFIFILQFHSWNWTAQNMLRHRQIYPFNMWLWKFLRGCACYFQIIWTEDVFWLVTAQVKRKNCSKRSAACYIFHLTHVMWPEPDQTEHVPILRKYWRFIGYYYTAQKNMIGDVWDLKKTKKTVLLQAMPSLTP